MEILCYGITPELLYRNPKLADGKLKDWYRVMKAEGAVCIQAHPYREAHFIDHIRLFPRCVHGVEVYNACRTELENRMALHYADSYGLLHFYGTDNHLAGNRTTFAGMESETPLVDEQDFVRRVLSGEMKPFRLDLSTPE